MFEPFNLMLAQNTELGLLTRFLKAKPHSLFVALIFVEGSKAQRCGGCGGKAAGLFRKATGDFTEPPSHLAPVAGRHI